MPTLHKPVFAKPTAGLQVRKEDGVFLPEQGDTVIHSTYWARREQDGDVTLSDELPAEESAKKSSGSMTAAATASSTTK